MLRLLRNVATKHIIANDGEIASKYASGKTKWCLRHYLAFPKIKGHHCRSTCERDSNTGNGKPRKHEKIYRKKQIVCRKAARGRKNDRLNEPSGKWSCDSPIYNIWILPCASTSTPTKMNDNAGNGGPSTLHSKTASFINCCNKHFARKA